MISRMAGTNPSRCRLCEADRKAAFAVATRRRIKPVRTRAMTLLETMMAMSLMTVISVIGAQTVRITWQAWDMQARRSDTLQHLSGTLTHITRHLRSARTVVEVSGPTDDSGFLAITLPDDSVVKWDHDSSSHRIYYGIDPPTSLLALDIDTLTFECFEIDGVTSTTTTTDIRMIRITSSVTVTGQSVPLAAMVWIRKQRDGLAAEYVDFHASDYSGSASWDNDSNLLGTPDGLLSDGDSGSRINAHILQSGYSGTLGTVLVGVYLNTAGPMGDDVLGIQIRDRLPGDGPVHTFGQPALLRFENNIDWFWVDVTSDYASWTYEDLDLIKVKINNIDAGAGGTTIYVDSVKIRTFEAESNTQTFWLTSTGSWNQEWRDLPGALGPPDSVYARSNLTFYNDVDRQAYFHAGSWEDLGTIVRVRLIVKHLFITAPFVDDEFHVRFPASTESQEPNDTPVPNSAERVSAAELNLYVGSANKGLLKFDFTNLEEWTWPSLNSRFVRLYGNAVGTPDGGEIKVDAVGVRVRYVPPNGAGLVLWEEL
ncbi:MAG: hypothetical protein IH987_01735 [Planctomycetes bacterium]|nr:hypothetical protein [Planctomycetota bacterium]